MGVENELEYYQHCINKIQSFDFTEKEFRELSLKLRAILKPNSEITLSTIEVQFILALATYASNVPYLFHEHEKSKSRINEAKKILLKVKPSGSDKTKALKALGVDRDQIKNTLYLQMANFYKTEFKRTSEANNGECEGYYNGVRYTLTWKSSRQQKMSIIDAIIRLFYSQRKDESVGGARNAVIKILRKKKVENLPGLVGGGGEHYYANSES